MVDTFQLNNRLFSSQDMAKWISSRGLTMEAFMRMMHDLVTVKKLEEIYDLDIEREVQDHARFAASPKNSTEESLSKGNYDQKKRWLQINVALGRQGGDALPYARALFERLSVTIMDWRRQKVLDTFFFMRKPPDLRLRFLISDPEGNLLAQLESILSKLKDDGILRYFFPSIYEPEAYQFGGIEAVDLVHAYFDADSMAWISIEVLAELGRRTISTDILVLAVMNDLFFRTLECPSEVWDVWCNLASLIPTSQERPSEIDVFLIESLLPHASLEEISILQDYAEANQKLSAGLLQVQRNGKLHYGLRAIFPFIAMFHFNRHGLNCERQAVLANAMKAAWNPKRNLIGVDVDSSSTDTRNSPSAL
jgi:thiopeptide-type bacteriocin biosynthesis protein